MTDLASTPMADALDDKVTDVFAGKVVATAACAARRCSTVIASSASVLARRDCAAPPEGRNQPNGLIDSNPL